MRSLFLLSLVLLSSCRREEPMQTPEGLRLETTQLQFGDVYVGASKSLAVVLVNEGRASVTLAPSTSSPFQVASEFRVNGGERVELTVTFTPKAVGAANATLTLNESLTVELAGSGLEVPTCATTACTTAVFSLEEGRCVTSFIADDTACDPGCQAAGVCVTGECRATNAGNCDDGNPCTIDACGSNGTCVTAPRECPVSSGCMVASCSPTIGCTEAPIEDGTVCGEPTCAQGRICLAGQCETRTRPDALEQCSYVDFTTSGFSACAKNVAGVTRCWGDNGSDQLLRGAPTASVAPAPWNIGFEVASFTGADTPCGIAADGHLFCPSIFDGGDERFVDIGNPYGPCGVLTDGGLSRCPRMPDAGRALLTPAVEAWGTNNVSIECVRAIDGGIGCSGVTRRFMNDGGSNSGFSMLDFAEAPRQLHVDQGLWALMNDGGVETRGTPGNWLNVLPDRHQPWSDFAIDSFAAYSAWGVLADRSVEWCRLDENSSARSCSVLSGNHTFTKVRAGHVFACGLDAQRRLWCWGNNQYGQLGMAALAQSPRTLGLEGVLAHEGGTTCFTDGGCAVGDVAFTPPGSVDEMCGALIRSGNRVWQVDLSGTLTEVPHDGGVFWLQPSYRSYCNVAQPVDGDEREIVDSHTSLWTCTRRSDAGVDCEGALPFEFSDRSVRFVSDEHVPMPPVTTLRSSGTGICGRTSNGRVWCWGDALGYPAVGEVPLVGVRQLECTDHACCALHGINGVSCWGDNARNQLGANGPASRTPRAVAIDEPVRALSHDARCAYLTSGRVRCWAAAGNISPMTSDVPVQMIW